MTKKQIGKRFLQILIVLIGVSFFTFGLTYLSPGDPAEIMLTECGNLPTPELLEQTRHELGLDQPFLRTVRQLGERSTYRRHGNFLCV